MRTAAKAAGKQVAVGFKKMFMPANEKAKELMALPDFGTPTVMTLQYPQTLPTVDELGRYLAGERVGTAVGFLDHLCHPGSLLLHLAGMPRTLSYQKSPNGGGVATFTFATGLVASLALTGGAANNGGMERTMIVSDRGRHILVEDNLRVSYHRNPPALRYGESPSFYTGGVDEVIASWQPEHSLGQLYNKGLFVLGYFRELEEFCRAILEGRALTKGTLDDAWNVTRLFEGFAKGPGITHSLDKEKHELLHHCPRRPFRSIRLGRDHLVRQRSDRQLHRATLGRCIIRPGMTNPLHHHDNTSEVLTVVAGTIMHTADSGEVKMEDGRHLTLPAGLPHRARNIGNIDAVLIIAYPTAHRQWSSDEPR